MLSQHELNVTVVLPVYYVIVKGRYTAVRAHRLRGDHKASYFFLNQKATFTRAINAGTSTNGPITPAKAWPLLMPNTPMATAMASSKLLPAAYFYFLTTF